MADELAAQGFIVVAPDLLSGFGPNGGGTDAFPGQDAVTRAVSALDPVVVTADLDAAADYGKKLPSANGRLFVAGFCWGGGKSFDFATHRRDLSAAFVFYGPPPADDRQNIAAPVYGFYGGNDARIAATVPATTAAMKAAGKIYEPVTYDGAGHGFMRAGEDPTPPFHHAGHGRSQQDGAHRSLQAPHRAHRPGEHRINAAAQRRTTAQQRPQMAAIGVPVAGMPFVHDPSTVVRFHGKYYVFSTGRGAPFYSSPDIVTWTREGSVFTADSRRRRTPPVPKNNGTDVWAPDIIRLGNQFYLYYAVSSWGSFQSAIGLATNPALNPKDPAYKWTDRGVVVTSDGNEDLNAIDPGVILAPDGTLWLCYGSYHGSIRVTSSTRKTGLALAPKHLGATIATARESEASDIIFHDGFYYLFVNHGSCCKGKTAPTTSAWAARAPSPAPIWTAMASQWPRAAARSSSPSDGRRIGPGHFGLVRDYDTEPKIFRLVLDLIVRLQGKGASAADPEAGSETEGQTVQHPL